MPHPDISSRPSPLLRIFVIGLVASVMPLGTAHAQTQSLPHVRVVEDNLDIKQFRRGSGHVVATASAGTVLEVLSTEGDMYTHRDTNWYFVLFPPDAWGTRRPGWISGRDVEYIPAVPLMPAAPATARVEAQPVANAPVTAPNEVPRRAAVASVPSMPASETRTAPTKEPAVSEVVLYLDFGKSNLTDEARGKLAAAISSIKANTVSVSFALEGHADWVGSVQFNERLGLARAEIVKQFLNDQFKIPADKINVVSYGEQKPAASNSTEDGRALNRRVLIKVGT